MAHKVETMAYANEVPWHGLGKQVDGKLSAKEMLKEAGLNWTVNKEEVFTASGIKVPDRFALVRSRDKKPLSICGSKYVPIQNEDSFGFFTGLVKAGKMTMETAGSLDNGARIWGLAKMHKGDFALPGDDVVNSYLLLCQPHIPGQKMTIMFTPIRVVCHNTLTYALQEAKGKGVFQMSHRTEFDDDMKAMAEMALGLSTQHMSHFKEQAEFLTKRKASEQQVDQYFADLYHKGLDTSVSDDWNQTVARLRDIYSHQPGAELSDGSWWKAFNAVTYYVDHVASPKSQNNRLRKAWFGQTATQKHKALDMALTYAKDSKALRVKNI